MVSSLAVILDINPWVKMAEWWLLALVLAPVMPSLCRLIPAINCFQLYLAFTSSLGAVFKKALKANYSFPIQEVQMIQVIYPHKVLMTLEAKIWIIYEDKCKVIALSLTFCIRLVSSYPRFFLREQHKIFKWMSWCPRALFVILHL